MPTKKVRMSPRLRKALEKARERPLGGSFWKPAKDGDYVSGRVLSIQEQDGKYGTKNVIALHTDDGETISVSCNVVLDRQLTEEKIKAGQDVVILFRGLGGKKTKGRNPVKLFSISRL